MKSNTTLDYAVFQLTPKRSHCELLISGNGCTEKLASGLLKPFLSHLQVIEDRVAVQTSSVKLQVDLQRNGGSWFTKGTLERFVRFVSTPEILEKVNSFDLEMSQLEAARNIYSQGAGDWYTGEGDENGVDATKKELLRAIDVRLTALKQDLITSFSRASAAGFHPGSVTGLQSFAECFGAHRLNEACTKFIALCRRRPELVSPQMHDAEDQVIRASFESDMSLDDSTNEIGVSHTKQPEQHSIQEIQHPRNDSDEQISSKESKRSEIKKVEDNPESLPTQPSQPAKRLSVQDRINMFENKQKENSGGKSTATGKSVELRRLSSDVTVEKTVLRRWSGASDMSIDLGNEKKEVSTGDSAISTQENIPLSSDDGKGSSHDTTSSVRTAGSSMVRQKGQIENLNLKVAATKSIPESVHALSKSDTMDEQTEIVDDEEKSVISPMVHISSSYMENKTDLGNSGNLMSGKKSTDLETRDQAPNFSSGKGASNSKVKEAKSNQSGLQTKKSMPTEVQMGVKSSASSFKEDLKTVTTVANSQKSHSAASERQKKNQQPAEENNSLYCSGKTVVPSMKVPDLEDRNVSQPEVSVNHAHRMRNSKMNQELNAELKMKASELEKLFAEHKLRAPGDHSGSMRNKPIESQLEISQHDKNQFSLDCAQDCGDSTEFCTPPAKGVTLFSEGPPTDQLSYDDSRGKFYEKYKQKRDAKLKEECGTKRAEKEAKLKSLHDSLERSRAEMNAKLSGSLGRRGTAPRARQKIEKQKSFDSRSNLNKEHILDCYQSEEDESFNEYFEQKAHASLGDADSRSPNLKKNFPNRSLPRISGAPSSRSSSKAAVSVSMKRNPLAQSVPVFADLKKDNAKFTLGSGKGATKSQQRSLPRSKSASDEVPVGKDDKNRRSQALRKTTASSLECKDTVDIDDDNTELVQNEQLSKGIESKPFLRKGYGIGPGAGASIRRQKASMAEIVKNEEESDLSPDEYDVIAKDENEELVSIDVEENVKAGLSQESEKMALSDSDNGEPIISLSQTDPTTADIPDLTHSGSPVSWNSRTHQFSYAHEISDLDAFVDSPTGSPGSWNSSSLTAADVDAARMRKKWGSAQKPLLVANSSNSHARKDVTKGFKRLLKFGRKSRGTENMVDWISATTSEGDDDTEDGRESANRSSEDLRKSRMAYALGHLPDDGYNDNELFSEHGMQSSIPVPPANFKLRDDPMSGSSVKAPRSFFSLSSFRSKGSDPKPR